MFLEQVGPCEGVGAEGALERSFSGVPPKVPCQDGATTEPPVADRAHVWAVPLVGALVAEKVGLVGQAQGAQAALEGALPSVCTHVALELRAREVALGAVLAAVGAQALVSAHVLHQAAPGLKALGADAAAVLLAVLVHALMFRQLVPPGECPAALGAVERPNRTTSMHFDVHR